MRKQFVEMKPGLVVVTVFLLLSSILFAQKIPPVPGEWVADYANLLTAQQRQTLNALLRAYEDSTSNQIVVAIFPDAQGYPVEEFSIRLAEAWKIGHKNRDNGIILAVFLKERKIRTEVGYGLEDVVPDAVAFQIQQQIMVPLFKQGKYYEGIYQGLLYLMKAASGKFKGFPKKPSSRKRSTNLPLLFLVFIIIIVLSRLGRLGRSATFGSRGWRGGGPFFWGGFGGGGFGGGGGLGGGGFSPGGGSFGGGGATSSW